MEHGFIYLWFDRKNKRFYLGAHWGKIDDGYICSSKWMKRSYKNRPQHFKRRILKIISTNRIDMYEEEKRWLQMIKTKELGKRYYNLKIWHMGHWSTDPEYRVKSIRERISSQTKFAMARPDVRKKYEEGLKIRDDTSYRTEEYKNKIKQTCIDKQLNKGMITVRYPHEDKCFHVAMNDPRWLNGELILPTGHKRNTKPKPNGRRTGTRHHLFTGYYHTPWGKYVTIKDAVSACPLGSINEDNLAKWCKKQSDLIFGNMGQPSPIMQPEWRGKTRREVGFWFERIPK